MGEPVHALAGWPADFSHDDIGARAVAVSLDLGHGAISIRLKRLGTILPGALHRTRICGIPAACFRGFGEFEPRTLAAMVSRIGIS
jgi:hypothetical protein